MTSELGDKTSYGLEDDGRVTSMVEAPATLQGRPPPTTPGHTSTTRLANRARVTDPLAAYNQLAYDATNNLTQATDQLGNATAYSYDVLDRLWKVTPPAAGGTSTLRNGVRLRRERRQPRHERPTRRARHQLENL